MKKKKRASAVPEHAKLVANMPRNVDLKNKPKNTASQPKSAGRMASAYELGLDGMPPQSNAVLRIAIIISVVFHLGLLTIQFGGAKAISSFFERSTLEVVLLNAESQEVPTNAQLLAQTNYAGGGDSAQQEHSASPVEHWEENLHGDAFEETLLQLSASRQESLRLLGDTKALFAQLPPIDPSWGEDDPRRLAEEERRRELSNQIAAIEQRIHDENTRPRRIHIGPTARRDAQAMYYDTIRKKIEQRGIENFPQHAGLPLYGQLLMEIIVSPSGDVRSTNVMESSGNRILDNQAQAIAISAGPFKAAPSELLRVDSNVEFAFLMRFHFLKGGQFEAQLENYTPRR